MSQEVSRTTSLPTGTLRLGEIGNPIAGTSASFKTSSFELQSLPNPEPISPQPSIDRLSVTFANDLEIRDKRLESSEPLKLMDKVNFPQEPQASNEQPSDDEDYSASVTAIMQRRASERRSKKRRSSRRGSSQFSPDILPVTENGRRRSSAFTSSSGDTAITIEDSLTPSTVTQEQIFENIKLHKDVLANVKLQPWNMRKKLKLVTQAKAYIKKHEGELQERFAQTHSTKDMLARCNIFFVRKLRRFQRGVANFSKWLVPWELRIKEIESHFGSVVASYFIFLRWLFWVNIAISTIWITFVTVPEMLATDYDIERKSILPEDKYNSTNFLTLWDFEGVFKYSPMFYGWYTNTTQSEKTWSARYSLPLAYFFTGLMVYIFSFVATLRKMAENSRMSKLSEKEDECIFSWKLFTGWDYMIGNAETAHNRVASIVMGFKEALVEEAEKRRKTQSWRVIGSRMLVNIAVLSLLGLSAFAVITVVARSKDKEASSTTWRRNEITVVMSLISLVFPIVFELLSYFEHYHPRKQLRLQLARIMVLNLLNLYSLIFALFGKINTMTHDLQSFKPCPSDSLNTNIGLGIIENVCECSVNPIKDSLPIGNLVQELVTDPSIYISKSLLDTYTNTTFSIDFKQAITTALSTIFNELENSNSSKFPVSSSDLHTYSASTSSPYSSSNSDEWQSILPKVISSPQPHNPNCLKICEMQSSNDMQNNSIPCLSKSMNMSYQQRSRLRSLCWETMFGQELTIMDLVMTLISTLAIDLFRALFVRYMNNCWCWDLEKKFPQYGDFKVAENILHLVNNQGMVWMGMFFAPGVVLVNVLKLYILMYLRSWAVLACNVPHEVIFRASRSHNFYYALLLMMLFLCVLPVSYAIVWLEPSWHCGPFSGHHRIMHIFTHTLRSSLPVSTHRILDYIASPGIVIPLLMLLILVIYYLISLSNALREANNDLKIQLRRERTEERRKMFQIADRRHRGWSYSTDTPFGGKWKKLLEEMPSNCSINDTSRQTSIVKNKWDRSKDKMEIVPAKSSLSTCVLRASRTQKSGIADFPLADNGTNSEPQDNFADDLSTQELNRSYKTDKCEILLNVNAIDIHSERCGKIPIGAAISDPIASNWVDTQIPIITISKTASSNSILDTEDKSLEGIDNPTSKADN